MMARSADRRFSHSPEEIKKLQGLEAFLKAQIIGQDAAIEQITKAIQRAYIGLRDKPGRVQGNFLFLGPTGVGKTETTLCFTRFLYGDTEGRIARFDMGEYQTEESLQLMIGKDQNRQGLLGDAIDRINSKGGGVILFDEIEKASKPLVQVFLGIMDAARVTMSTGETKNLEKMFLVFTSNLGTADAMQMENLPYASLRRHVLRVAEDFFGAPIMGRFQEKLVFRRLTHEVQIGICEKMLNDEVAHVEGIVGHKLEVHSSVFPFLIKRGYDKMLGARPMRDTIEREIGNAVTEWVLSQEHAGCPRAYLMALPDRLEIVRKNPDIT